MTATYTIPINLGQSIAVAHSFKSPGNVSFVIPVFNDFNGLVRSLNSLEQVAMTKPVVVIDDGSEPSIKKKMREFMASRPKNYHFIDLEKNLGAAHARNIGVSMTSTDWIAFVDCDCELAPNFLAQAMSAIQNSGPDCVAVCGTVKGTGGNEIAEFMDQQGIMNPPLGDDGGPLAIITANSFVYRPAFDAVEGFDESFPGAGGEDIDLGIRLRTTGSIILNKDQIARHWFPPQLAIFRQRFKRYGRAARLLERKWSGDWAPKPFLATNSRHQMLADIQYAEMLAGYQEESACGRNPRTGTTGSGVAA